MHPDQIQLLPGNALESHALRVQAAHQLAIRRILGAIGGEFASQIWGELSYSVNESSECLVQDYFNGRGPIAASLSRLVQAGELEDEAVTAILDRRMPKMRELTEEERSERTRVENDEEVVDYSLSGHFHSHVNVRLGVNSERRWNHEKLDALYAEGRIFDVGNVPKDASAIFRIEQQNDVFYIVRLLVESDNRNLIHIGETTEVPEGRVWVDLEQVWMPHTDLRMTPGNDAITAAADALFAELGLTEDQPVVEQPDVPATEEANFNETVAAAVQDALEEPQVEASAVEATGATAKPAGF